MRLNNTSFSLLGGIAIGALAPGLACAAGVNLASGNASVAHGAPDSANQATPQAMGVADIVVTAQRRSESTQKAPISIDVVSQDMLRQSGASQTTDLSRITPGVQIAMGGSATQVFVRGAGTPTTTPLSDPSVSLNIDGVYIARSQSFNGNMFDLDRVEVLKGPQGTLYGRNSSGGALNLVAATPKLGQTTGYVQLGAQSYNGINAEAAVNIALGDKVAVRAAGQIVHRDGYISDGTDDDQHESARLQVLYKPSNDFSLRLWSNYQHIGGTGPGYVAYDPAASTPGGAYVPADRWTGVTPLVNQRFQTIFKANPDFNISQAYQNINSWNVHAQADVNLGFGTLTVIPAYQKVTIRAQNFPGIGYSTTNYQTGAPQQSKATSVEARISDHGGSRLTYTAGFFYYDEQLNNNSTVYLGAAAPGVLGPNIPGATGALALTYTANLSTKSYAGFGQAGYELFRNFKLIGGLRYTNETHEVANGTQCLLVAYPANSPCLASATGLPDASGQKVYVLTSHLQDKRVNYKAGFEYQIAPQNMVYFTVSTGFKSGGQPVAAVPAYLPETLTAYTLGSKNRFFGGRLQANIELFWWNFNNKQEALQRLDAYGTSQSTTINAGTATSKGVSIDLRGKLTANDTVGLNGEYDRARYGNFVWTAYAKAPSTGCAFAPVSGTRNYSVNCSGYQMMRSPDWSGSANYVHTFRFANGAHLDANVNSTFASSRWIQAAFIANARIGGYALLNAGLTYVASGGKYSVDFFAQNLTNKAVYTGGDQNPVLGGLFAATINAPRVFGGRIRYNF
ncbi:MAG: TonB-dependent receptor [Sphingomonadales bacterium]|nr:TonB-dependent receptor [Sphingomonadales bacterium]MDE2170859.1 TonB-dependent receptor [Sphingomonadales bacterium]